MARDCWANMLFCDVYPRYTRAEEAALAAGAAFSDDTAILARNELVMSCVPLAIKIAGHGGRDYRYVDDVIDAAVLSLWKAVKAFNPKRGRLTTVAAKVVRQEVARYVRQYCRGIISGPLNFPRNERTKEQWLLAKREMCGLDFVGAHSKEVSPELQLERLLEHDRLQTWIAESLTLKEQDIIDRRFYKGETCLTVGQHYGVTRSRIQQIEARAIGKLRKAAGE